MDSIPFEADQAIAAAVKALRSGDKKKARRYARQAASLAPNLEYAWLVLAEVAEPTARIAYLEQAIRINPGRASTCKQLELAREKVNGQADQPVPVPSGQRAQSEISANNVPKRASHLPVILAGVTLIALVFLAGWGNSRTIFASVSPLSKPDGTNLENSSSDGNIPKPTQSPTITASPTPTMTSTVTPFPTASYSATPIQSQPDNNSFSPAPMQLTGDVYRIQAGDTLFKISQGFGVGLADLAAANSISVQSTLYVGQNLVIPGPGYINISPSETEENQPIASDDQYVLVDISEQHLYAYESGVLVFSFVASTGMNNATRVGTFSVLDKIPNAYGANWDIWMPNWLGIYWAGSLQNGIHALPILSNGARLWSGYLGTPISFGCVVLGVSEAQQLYDWVDIGTPVEIQW
jgi:LysM repeat protein